MRIAFAGTPHFALKALQALHLAGHSIELVLTQPDRPAGRGMNLLASPVKQWAQQQNIATIEPRGLNLDGRWSEDAHRAHNTLQSTPLDVMVVAAYGLILPQWALHVPAAGCLNLHASLLPRWRGAAPIQRAIEAGDLQTGVTIMQMDAGLDTGAIITSESTDIAPTETAGSLHDRLAQIAAKLIVHTLDSSVFGTLQSHPQPTEGVTYAHKIIKSEARLDWNSSALQLERTIRAFDPVPGAVTNLGGTDIKIWGAHVNTGTPIAQASVAGQILSVHSSAIVVACGDQGCAGSLCLTHLQRPGGKRLSADQFLRGFEIEQGQVFTSASAPE